MTTSQKKKGPRVLTLDIETAPILGYVWRLWDQNVALNQIKADSFILSWSAKWLGEKEVLYQDSRGRRDISDDKHLAKGIWRLLDEADIVITQNGDKFDLPRLNALFLKHGLQPTSSHKRVDLCKIAKSRFGFTSNKLEYMTEKFCVKYKKLKHKRYPGFELWLGCLADEPGAWDEMEKYNRQDVLATEELYHKMQPWTSAIPNFSLYSEEPGEHTCACGSTEHSRNGYYYKPNGKYQRYRCNQCGTETVDKYNLIEKSDRKNIRARTTK